MNCDRKKLDVVRKISRSIAQAAAPAEVYQLIVDELAEVFNVERVSLMVYDPKREGLVIAASRGMPCDVARQVLVRLGEGISGRVFAGRKPVLLSEVKAEQRVVGRYKTSSFMSAPVMCSPIKMGDEPLGVINVTDRLDGTIFSEGDLDLLETVADLAASYIHLTKLADVVNQTAKLRQELEIARNIQYRLLPVRPPAVRGLDVAGRCITAERVGGDYYDYFLGNRVAFGVADVSGHSIGAAMIMSAFRAAIRSQLSGNKAIASAVSDLNAILYEDLFQAEQFVSLAIAEFDCGKDVLRCTTAGHLPILVWSTRRKRVEKVWTDDPLIGIDLRACYSSTEVSFEKGDIAMLYSDGLTEAANERGRRFGCDRLIQVLERSEGNSFAIVEQLVSMLFDFVHPAPLRDDVTIVVVRRTA